MNRKKKKKKKTSVAQKRLSESHVSAVFHPETLIFQVFDLEGFHGNGFFGSKVRQGELVQKGRMAGIPTLFQPNSPWQRLLLLIMKSFKCSDSELVYKVLLWFLMLEYVLAVLHAGLHCVWWFRFVLWHLILFCPSGLVRGKGGFMRNHRKRMESGA